MTDSTIRINLTISRNLLAKVDEAAGQDFTSRSDIIRIALLSYLRSAGRTGLDIEQTNPDLLLATLKTKKLKAYVKHQLKQNKQDN